MAARDGDRFWKGHRQKLNTSTWTIPACVARPVNKNKYEHTNNSKGANQAREAMAKEWGRLIDRGVWSYAKVREWSELARAARAECKTIHMD